MRTLDAIDAELRQLDEVIMKTRVRMRACARERDDVVNAADVQKLKAELEAKTGGKVTISPAGIPSAEQVNGIL